MSLNFSICFYKINENISIAVQLKKILQRTAKKKKLCALGSAVGSLFLGTGAGCTGCTSWWGTGALWGICPLFVALINNLRTKQHLKVLFLELSI